MGDTLLSSDLVASPPLVIDGESDVVISGLHVSNPDGTCIEIKGDSRNITIKDNVIGPCGSMGIDIVSSANVTVIDNYINNTKDSGVRPHKSNTIQVKSNQFERVASGVYAANSQQVDVSDNYFLNIQGPFPRGQLVQFDGVTGTGNSINNNVGINEPGKSYPQDAINVYRSSGTPDDYIQVKGNVIVGGGPSTSGGGIILGDRTGSYQRAEDNIVVNAGSYGISLSAGHHLVLSRNKVYTDGSQPIANTGIIVGYQAQQNDYECRDFEISGNEITFWRGEDQLRGAPESHLDSDYKWSGCNPIAGWDTNKLDTPKSQPADLDPTILPVEIQELVSFIADL